MTKENALANFLDSQDFYELMQAYRHEPLDAAKQFEAVRLALYAAIAQPVQPATTSMKCEDCDGCGAIGELYGGSAFQPPERDSCNSCGGSGYWNIAQPVQPAELWEQLVSIGQEVDTQPAERNFCQRCGQRLGDADHIHTCTPPVDATYDSLINSVKATL